jgi:twitching motility protein PilT
MRDTEHKLGRLLVDRRLLSVDDLERLALDAKRSGQSLTRLLIETGRVSDHDVLAAIAAQVGLPLCDVSNGFRPDPAVVRMLDETTAVRLSALPYGVDTAGRVQIAVANPLDQAVMTALRVAVGADLTAALADRAALQSAIADAYGSADADTSPDGPSLVTVAGDEDADRPHLNELLERLVEMGGSDLHVTAGSPPQVRVNGALVALDDFGILRPAPLRALVYEILTQRQKHDLEEERELDCSHPLPGKGRFRVNVFFQRDSIGAVMRAIPNEIVPLTKLGMPPVVSDFAQLSRGMVLVTGPTGSGKSTTLASLIDLINSTRPDHIMTVEDPIEFIHRHKMSIVNQREVGTDTISFAAALKHALRQDPDVILVGEMRDLETIATAITAAETGHLVFATLHTQDAPKSVERIIDVFPSNQQQQVRVQLASSLQAVLAQQLLPRKDGKGRAAAVETMIVTPAIRNMIREGKVHQIATAMQAGGKFGMQTMDQALAGLVKDGTVDYRVALERCHDADGFNNLVGERFTR